MADIKRGQVWTSGAAYERYVGRWSRLVAREFLHWLAIPPQSDWLDVGSGTGALTQTILQESNPRSVKGVDPSSGFVDYAREQVQDARVSFETGDANRLPLGDAAFDAAVSGLVLNFVPNANQAVAEMARVTRPGGIVAAYVWDYAGMMQFLRLFWETASELDPTAVELDEGRRFEICRRDRLAPVFNSARLKNVENRALDVPTIFPNFDDYWSPFLGGQGPAASYAMSLGEAQRDTLRDRIRARLPIASDGSIRLIARAWAARGTQP